MVITSHKTRSVFDRYNIINERDLNEAAHKLDAYLSEKRAALSFASQLLIRDKSETPLV